MARKPWKAMLVESLLPLALVLSILRTDLRHYLRNYSRYPEVQQILLGESAGLNLVDSLHYNDLIYPSKYTDEYDHIYSELSRLSRSPQIIRPAQYIATWLVTNDSAPIQVAQPSSTSVTELTRQEADLVEQLWKQDLNRSCGRDQPCSLFTGTENHEPLIALEILEDLSDINSPTLFSFDDLMTATDSTMTSIALSPRATFQAQTSLEDELDELDDFVDPNEVLTMSDRQPIVPSTSTNYSGGRWNSQQFNTSFHTGEYNSLINTSMDLEVDLPDLVNDVNLSDVLTCLPFNNHDSVNLRDSVSEDSAVSLGSSSPNSWSERFSESSDSLEYDDFSLNEVGAVGYTQTKLEPQLDSGFFDLESSMYFPIDKHAVYHDHTYGAPPGGVPHVRKMDIKVQKEPSRGFAHDEIMCKKLKVPFSVDTIINTPVDEFNKLLKKHTLNSKQVNLIKDIRRRGKNKVAAQNCRKKKIGELSELDSELQALRTQKTELTEKKTHLLKKSTEARKHIDIMSAEIFSTLRDENGLPYNTSRFSIEVGTNGEVVIARNSRRDKSQRKREKKQRKQ